MSARGFVMAEQICYLFLGFFTQLAKVIFIKCVLSSLKMHEILNCKDDQSDLCCDVVVEGRDGLQAH